MVTSNELFDLKELPTRVLVIGGGYIGTEFAGIFHGYGADVTLVHRGDALLATSFDHDVRRALTRELAARGIALRLERTCQAVAPASGGYQVSLSCGETLTADLVVAATGRVPLVDGLGCDAAGIALGTGGEIAVDAAFQTSVPHIYAVGDVIGGHALTPVALAQGMWVAKRLFGDHQAPFDRTVIPTAVFTAPPVGTVGLTEQAARAAGRDVAVYVSDFRPLQHTLSGRDERTFMKLVVDRASDRVLGCHMVGADAGEIIQGFGVALNAGATKAQFDSTIGVHPTAAEEFVTMRQERSEVLLP